MRVADLLRRKAWTAWRALGAAFVSAFLAASTMPVIAAPDMSRFNADYFTNLTVVTHEGKAVPFYDTLIKGKIVVFSFLYLNCNDICPLTTSRVAEIRDRLGDAVGRDIFFYSITMNPERDTPDMLEMHATAFQAGKGWLFLTGKPDDIKLIRWRLGERSRNLTEHRNDLILGNDITGEWSRTSAYADLDVSVDTIRALDPAWRSKKAVVSSTTAPPEHYRIDRQPGQALFVKACATCHTVGGGDLVGPDLKDIMQRREAGWLKRFLMAPDKMRAAKDPLTLEISEQYKGVNMPNLGLKDNDVADLLVYIEALSKARDVPQSASMPSPQ